MKLKLILSVLCGAFLKLLDTVKTSYVSRYEAIREALRVYELVEQKDNDPQLEAALRQALRSPLKKYQPGHFAALVV